MTRSFSPRSLKGVPPQLARPSPGKWASLTSASTCLLFWKNVHLEGARSGRPRATWQRAPGNWSVYRICKQECFRRASGPPRTLWGNTRLFEGRRMSQSGFPPKRPQAFGVGGSPVTLPLRTWKAPLNSTEATTAGRWPSHPTLGWPRPLASPAGDPVRCWISEWMGFGVREMSGP